MPTTVLIVEDEVLVAMNLRHTLAELGYEVVGIARDTASADRLIDSDPDIALVDLNLRDGYTGQEIGRKIANETGASVLFVTANPRDVSQGVPGTVGVLAKPYDEATMGSAVEFLVGRRAGATTAPPSSVRIFH